MHFARITPNKANRSVQFAGTFRVTSRDDVLRPLRCCVAISRHVRVERLTIGFDLHVTGSPRSLQAIRENCYRTDRITLERFPWAYMYRGLYRAFRFCAYRLLYDSWWKRHLRRSELWRTARLCPPACSHIHWHFAVIHLSIMYNCVTGGCHLNESLVKYEKKAAAAERNDV